MHLFVSDLGEPTEHLNGFKKLVFERFHTKHLETSHLIPFDKNIQLNEHLRVPHPEQNRHHSQAEYSQKTGWTDHILRRK